MHWYDGSIAEAVNLSKTRNAIFVVFVEGEDDLSTEMSATIDEPLVLDKLADQSSFLAIKLKSGSVHYTHFAQLYQFVPVPSLFFIGRNGTPLEVVCAGVAASDLAARVTRILDEHRKDKPPQPSVAQPPAAVPQPSAALQPSTSAQALRQQTAELIQAETTSPVDPVVQIPVKHDEPEPSSQPAAKIQKTEHHEVTRSGQEYDVVCDGDLCVRQPRPANEPGPSRLLPATEPLIGPAPAPSPTESQSSIEERAEKARLLIEARRREKEEKEKEAERQKEIERRTAGQGVAELKRWQADQDIRQIQEERKREKLENNLARQRILEQIAQDRAERRARDAPPAPVDVKTANDTTTVGDAGTRTRIQFKLPDGVSHTAHFESDQTLEDVQKYVCDNLQLTRSSFSLWTAFPRRELCTPEETLRQLNLTPSAALLVLTTRANTVAPAQHSLQSFIELLSQLFTAYVLEPTYQAVQWLRDRLFPVSPPGAGSTAGSDTPLGRRMGNVHRLSGERASDDDNNTWNGNSTQQM